MLTQNSMIETLKDFVVRLDRLKIEYMITGSFAMHAYAIGRLTYDIDAIIEISGRNAAGIEAAFLPDYYVSKSSIIRAIKNGSMFNIINQKNSVKIDCIVRKPSGFEAEKFARRRKSEIDGIAFWVISREDLILSKLDWAKKSLSEKQFLDVRNLIESGPDLEFLNEQIERLQLGSVWAEFDKWKIRIEK